MGHLIALLPPVLLIIGVVAVGYRLVIGSRDQKKIEHLLQEAKAAGPSSTEGADAGSKQKKKGK